MDSIRKKMAHAGSPEEKDGDYPQKIFIRSEMDAFTVSLDSSGLHLHKRGIKAVHGKAPLRETLAASILMNAGYDGKMPLIDPMCGTGTFSMEAAMIATGTPPGMYRHFAFEQWPCFSEGAWDFIKKKWREKINTTSSLNIFSSDSSDMLCSAMKANGAGPFTEGLIIGCDDFFNMNPLSLTEEKGLVVINPPYGIRLGSKNESKKRIDRIFFTLRDKYKGWSAAIVSPWEKIPKGIVKDHRAVSLKHGGLDLFVHYFRIPEK
jgi:putative N6-adenine-specific DNA methylase